MTDLDNVIRPKFGDNNSRLSIKERYSSKSDRKCKHWHVVVDELEREVKCDDCGKELDPIQVLIEYAYMERRFEYRKSKMKEMIDRENKAREEEQKLKNRIRYAKNKLNKIDDK